MGLIPNPFKRNKETPEITLRKEEIGLTDEQQKRELASQESAYDWNVDSPGRAELIRWQQDLSPELQVMAMRLKNFYQDTDGEWIPKRLPNGKIMRPLCNDTCISELIALLDPCISRNLIMSHYDKDFIRQKLIDMANTITRLLASERKRFKIRMCDLTPIVRICQATFEPSHFRALQGNEKKYIASTHKYLHTESDKTKEETKKGGMWPFQN